MEKEFEEYEKKREEARVFLADHYSLFKDLVIESEVLPKLYLNKSRLFGDLLVMVKNDLVGACIENKKGGLE